MKYLRRVMRGVARISVLLAAAAAVTFLLAQDGGERASASHTEILPSLSSSSPTFKPTVIVAHGGDIGGEGPCNTGESDATTVCFYVWAKNVDNTTGASAFQLTGTYNRQLIQVLTFQQFNIWLGSTGRSVTCPAPTIVQDESTGFGEIAGSCNSLLAPPPYGPTGSGILAAVALESRSSLTGTTTLNFSNETYLVDTPADPDNAVAIPATVRSVNIVVTECADYAPTSSPDGTIRVGDILYVVGKYFTPDADLDRSGNTNVNDILIAVAQYFQDCSRD